MGVWGMATYGLCTDLSIIVGIFVGNTLDAFAESQHIYPMVDRLLPIEITYVWGV